MSIEPIDTKELDRLIDREAKIDLIAELLAKNQELEDRIKKLEGKEVK